MHRREFIWQSLSLAGAMPLAGLAAPGNDPHPFPATLHVLVDTRFAASRRFGAAAASRGARVSRYDGDLTQLWQNVLLPQWRAHRGNMAGVSTARGWLCLSQLAGEHRWTASMRPLRGPELVAWTLTPGVRS
jgi:hypothetical protein